MKQPRPNTNRRGGSQGFLITVLGLLLAAVLGQPAGAQYSYILSNAWTVANGATGTHLATGDVNRGVAYSAVSNQVFVVNKGITGSGTTPAIDVFDGTAGTYLASANMTGVSGGTFLLNLVGVGDDGIIYAAELNTSVSSSSAFKIYSWTNYSTAPIVAFSGDATAGLTLPGKRFGDTMDTRGAGTNTMMVFGINNSSTVETTNVVLFSTTDGVNFTNTIIAIAGLPALTTGGGNNFGISFFTNNTLLFKPNGGSAYIVQYPANFASLGSFVQGTVIGTVALSGGTVVSSVNPTAGLTACYGSIPNAGSSSTTVPLALYGAPPAGGFATALAATNTAHPNANGNYAGAVALGGSGRTNFIYTMDCNNGLHATAIIAVPPQPPGIATQPVGGSFYPPATLSVSATGSSLSYQWQATNAAAVGAFTNIAGATTNTYVIATASTNFYRVVITNSYGSATSTPVLVTILAPVVNAAVTNLWHVAAGTLGYTYLTGTSDGTRGIAYDTNSQRVVVSSTSGLYVLNANNGTNIETLSQTGVTFGGLLGGADQVGIADDGAVYVGNVINGGGNFNLYRWSAPSNIVTATVAFAADPGNGGASSERWGDTMAVRGAGAATQILLASRASGTGGTNVALLLPDDGQGLTYQSYLIAVSGVPADFAGYGIAFGVGNTFWAKSTSGGGDLYEIAFNTNTLTGAVVFDYKSPSQISGSLICAGVDPVNNIFASISDADSPHDLQLFQLTGTSDAPVLFQQSFFGSANYNGNGNAVVTVKYPRMYALDVDNGIVAVTYGVPATTAPTITTPPANVTVYTNIGSVTLSVGASGSLPLHYQWRFNSNAIAGATSSIYTISNTTAASSGYYDVVVHNIAGAVTSSPPAFVSFIVPVTNPEVVPVWSIGPGTNGSYLTTSGYETRGLAFDGTASNLLVADHFNIHIYNGTNGVYQSDVNTAGLPTSGINGWTIDQIGVADDGTLYSCNLSPDGTGFSIISYSPGSYSANYAYGGASGGNDLNTLDPAPDRWGDTMAVRGSGTDTEILFGSYNGTNVALFTTPDGVNFMPATIPVSGVPAGFAGAGIAFGPGNTFYAKGGHNYNLRQVAINTNAWTGSVLESYLAPAQVPNDLGGIGVDVTNNILGGVCFNDTPNDVQLYLLSGNTNAPYLFDQDFFPANNPNIQDSAEVVLHNGLGFALDVNNGVVAFTYSMPSAPPVTLTSVSWLPNSVTINWNNTFIGHDYQVVYKNSLLDAAWLPLGSPVTTTNATASYTDTTAGGATRFYRIISQ